MFDQLKTVIKIIFILSFFQVVVACTEEGEGSDSNGSTNPSNPIAETPVGEVESSGFWINVKTGGQFDVYVNSEDGFGNACSISIDETANKDMACYIDVLEGDLFMHDLEIQYNVPPQLCEHIMVRPAWFWNHSLGNGPTQITLEVDESGENPALVSCTAWHEGLASNVACNAHPELTDTLNVAGPSCVYDYIDSEGPNCCMGDYTLTINHDENGDGMTFVPETIEASWGGDFSACFGGGASAGWQEFTSAGLPGGLITAIPEGEDETNVGLNEVVKLDSNGSTTRSTFSTVSNFYTTNMTPHNHSGYYSATTSDLPYALRPIDDLDGSNLNTPPYNSPLDSYEFTCLDAGFEVKHRIKGYVREWNTLSEFVTYQTSEGAAYNPDVTGSEGASCDYDGVFGSGCNDRDDLDDILTPIGGSYNTTPPGTHADRMEYFPQIDY